MKKILPVITLLVLLFAGCVAKNPENEPNDTSCKDKCGDGVCQEIVCEALGCPCAETAKSCPADCSPKDDEPVIGGDLDEHGCLIAAGYAWCASKDKCLRAWEEECLPEYTVAKVLDSKCTKDADCTTPEEYLVLSHCPYESRCLNDSCTVVCPKPFSIPEKQEETGLANPASRYCTENGGAWAARQDARGYGEYGVCVLPNGTECEEWAYFKSGGRDCIVYDKTESVIGFCGDSTGGPCRQDKGCVTSGCSGQVCQSTSEAAVVTDCEHKDCFNASAYGLSCRCVSQKCVWTE